MLQYSREGYTKSNLNQRSDPNLKKNETTLSPIIKLCVLFRRSKTANSVVGSPVLPKFDVDVI